MGVRSERSHWVLMTKDVIPDSRRKRYNDQKQLIASHAQKSGIPYELPKALDAATAIFMHYVETGTRLYRYPRTYTRCQEKVESNQWPFVIGGFSSEGLYIDRDSHRFCSPDSGVGAVWKL